MNGIKGLTAQDRAAWEKQYEAQIKGLPKEKIDNAYYNHRYKEYFGDEGYEDFKKLPTDKRGEYLSTKLNPKIEIEPLDTRSDEEKSVDNIGKAFQQGQQYKEEADKLTETYNNWPSRGRKALDEFDKIAENISPYYKKYKNTEYLPFSDEDKYKIAAEYQAAKTAFGEDEANKMLRRKMQNTASENQGLGEKLWNGFVGTANQTVGALISTAGMIKGAIDYVGDERNEDIDNSFLDFMDHIIDNDWSRFGNDVMQYGSIFDAERRGAAKKSGISSVPIIRTTAEEEGGILDNLLSVNTIPELINQQGFTIASMLTGAGLSAISNKAFKGLKGLTIAANRAGTLSNLEKTNKVLKGLQQLQQTTNAFIIPGAVGTVEGVTEGLNTKIQFLDDAKKQIAETQSKAINDKFNQMLQNPEELSRLGYDPQSEEDLNRLYKDIFDSYAPRYEESVKKAEVNAAKAGIYNMGLNSAINGALNMTLKAGLQTPSVQEALRRSRLGRVLSPQEFKVSGNKVTSSFGKLKKVGNVLQEPFGEFTEEYLQSVTDAFARGGAEYNLQNYLNNKYKGDGKGTLDESLANDLFAASKAAGDAATDKETILAGIYGALSSGMGTPTINNRRGPAIRRENESKLQYSLRRSPVTYRNPIYEAIREQKEIGEERATTAQILTDWIQDPTNKSKYDGLVGTFNWAKSMEEASSDNDEFAYRNSELGKTINDVMMLEKIQGSDYYNSFMNDLTKAANIEEGSAEAQALIEQFKNAPSNRDSQLSDEEILNTIKKNSNKLLNTMSSISTESESIDKLLGNAANEDTKQALIYGKLSMDNWRERATQLEDELSQVEVTSTGSKVMEEGTERAIIDYGTPDKIKEAHNKILEKIKSLKEDVSNIEKRKNLNTKEQGILKAKKAAIKTLEKEAKNLTFDKIYENSLLTEVDIMQLNPADRAIMLNPENKSKYSERQQEIIDNVINQGVSKYNDFINKVQDAGRINLAQQAYLKQYNSILSDPESFNAFSNRIKQEVAYDNTKKKYQFLNEVTDYASFVRSLDKAYRESDFNERNVIRNILKDNSNYNRYIEDNKKLEGMFDQLETNDKFKDLTENDRSLIMTSMQFLTDKGISPTNREQALNALSSIDESGNSELLKYIEEINSRLPDGQRIQPSDISEIINTYLDIVTEEEKNTSTVEAVNKPVEVAPTTTEDSKPPAPTLNIFDEIDANPEAFKPINLDEVPKQDTPTNEKVTNPSVNADSTPSTKTNSSSEESVENSIIDKYKTNSNDEVAESVNNGLNVINKASSVFNDVKQQTIEVLNELGDSEYESSENLREAITVRANKIQAQSTEGGDYFEKLSSLLKQAAAKLQPKEETKTQEARKEANKATTVDNTIEQRRNNSMITTADVDRHPNSTVGRASSNFNIADYLRKGTITPKTPISFIADPAIIAGVKQEMGDIYNEEDHLPIMAVVEDSNGPIILGDKHYQPIGFMPRNSANTQGAARMNPIRSLALKQQDGQLVKDDEGNIITTNGYVRAIPPEHTKAGTPNTLIHTIMNNDMSEEERNKMNNPNTSIEERRSIYSKAKSSILSKIRRISKDNKGERIHLSYVTPNLKGGETEFELYITTPQNSLSRTGKPIAQVLLEGTSEEVIQANSRTYGYAKTLENFFKKKPFSDDFRFKREEGKLVPIGEADTKIKKLEESLGKKLSNYLSVPKGYEYNLVPTEEVVDGDRVYELSLTNGTNTIPLGAVSNSISIDAQASIIKNLMLDNNGFRYENNQPFIKWQVNYNDFSSKEDETEESRKARLRNINDIFDDNILESSRTSLKYSIKGVDINSPFKQDGSRTTVIKKTTVANPTNATQGKPINTPAIVANDQVNTGNAIVDSESGAVLEGKVEPDPSSLDKAKVIADRIVEDSKKIKLADDNSAYIDENGVRYARVTHIIQADEDATGRFESNSLWITPSTNIGTGIDEMVRDFFAGNLRTKEGRLNESIDIPKRSKENKDKTIEAAKTLNDNYSNNPISFTVDGTEFTIESREIPDGTSQYYKNTAIPLEVFRDYKAELYLNKLPLYSTGFTKNNDDSITFEGGLSMESNSDLNSYIKVTVKGNLLDKYLEAKDIAFKEREEYKKLGFKDINDAMRGVDAHAATAFAAINRALINNITQPSQLLDYPNISQDHLERFSNQLKGLKNYLDAQGWTVIPRDIAATGSIKVKDDKGVEHVIPVAGTLDLLAYDSQGNFHILDMKTFKSSIDSNKKKKYSKQLSLYQKFLEEKYGIKVASLNIIPIKVSYPSPIGKDKVTYEVKEGNQLLVNGEEFKDASPILEEVGSVSFTDVNIQYNKLSDSEKTMIKEQLPDEVKPASVTVEDNDNEVNKNIGLKMGKVKNRFGKKAKGPILTPSENNWNSLTKEQQDSMSKIGYTKEKWDNMTEEEKKHQKDCL